MPAASRAVIDLGAGTGLLSAFLRMRLPDAALHLIDISDAMLQQARARLAGQSGITFEVADYSSAPLRKGVDAIVSALSIHHLEDEAKRLLFARVCSSLRPGGIFINAEQVLGPTPELESRYKAIWLQQVRALGATDDQVAASLFRQREDRCATVDDQLAWMRAAGFVDVDCWFKDNRFAVLSGTKPSLDGA